MRARSLLGFTSCFIAVAVAQHSVDDLTNLSIEDLFRIQITSVGRKVQQLSKAPAAAFVLTADDIRRSGATSIPEALKWVPGLTVLQIDGRYWSISARGSARLYADKILVMVDGRSLYTPLFAGVMWESLDIPLDLIEQIEVVLGPGAVMWGPNAVNGVINIITRRSRAAPGATVTAASGNDLHGSVLARWSSAPNEHVAYQIWGEFQDRKPSVSSPASSVFDSTFFATALFNPDLESKAGRAGFRADLTLSPNDELTLEGAIHKSVRQEYLGFAVFVPGAPEYAAGTTKDDGGFVLGRWTHTSSSGSEDSLQFAFSSENANFPFVQGVSKNLTFDYQRRRRVGEYHELYWGGGFQQYWDDNSTRRFVGFEPESAVYRAGNLVVRDEFQVIPDRLLLTAGIRVDHNAYTHFEFQPSLRCLYTPSSHQSMWLALSRAIRVPSRFDRDMHSDGGTLLLGGLPIQLDLYGSTSMKSEVAKSMEFGHRLQLGKRLSVDSSGFLTFYERLRALQGPLQPSFSIVDQKLLISSSLTEQNVGTGRSYGGEVSATWDLHPAWRLIPAYTYLNERSWHPSQPDQIYGWLFLSSSSRHQAQLRSQFDLPHRLQVDLMSRVRSRNLAFDLPGVLLVDARLGWRPNVNTEFSISAQNLADRRVLETYSESPFVAIPVHRTFAVKWTQRF